MANPELPAYERQQDRERWWDKEKETAWWIFFPHSARYSGHQDEGFLVKVYRRGEWRHIGTYPTHEEAEAVVEGLRFGVPPIHWEIVEC